MKSFEFLNHIHDILIIVPVQEKKAKGENQDDEEDVDPVAGLILDSLSHSFIAALDVLGTGHSISVHSFNIISLLQNLLCKD